ncbi:MAG: DUF1501 domain-containing protein [Pirellulaceae bacterium]|nr:DUF1501 domain-containing protein [Pirellulaceae bacterium]
MIASRRSPRDGHQEGRTSSGSNPSPHPCTPRINQDVGRDHWPDCFSAVLVAGGNRAGYVHTCTLPTYLKPSTARGIRATSTRCDRDWCPP